MTLAGWKGRVGLAFISFSFNFCKVLNYFLLLPSFPFLPLSHGLLFSIYLFSPRSNASTRQLPPVSRTFKSVLCNRCCELNLRPCSTFSPQCWSLLFSGETLPLCYIHAHGACLSHFGYPQTSSGCQNSIVSPVWISLLTGKLKLVIFSVS